MKIINKLLSVIVFLSWNLVKGQEPVNFELFSATDNSHFVSGDAKGKYIALHFLLKTECPYCLRHTSDYVDKAGRLPDVIQIFIKPDTEEEIRAWSEKLSADDLANFPIYRDPDARLADRFNIPNGYQFHGQLVHYPALILIGPDGTEVFRYIGKNNSDRYPFEQLETKVRELTKK
jgi:peroxiredoxin Q/BCP